MKGPRKLGTKKQAQPTNIQLMQAIMGMRLPQSQKAAVRALTAGMCDFAFGHMTLAMRQLWKEAEEAKDPDKWMHVSIAMKAYTMVCEAMELPSGKKMFEEREAEAMNKVELLTETPPEPGDDNGVDNPTTKA